MISAHCLAAHDFTFLTHWKSSFQPHKAAVFSNNNNNNKSSKNSLCTKRSVNRHTHWLPSGWNILHFKRLTEIKKTLCTYKWFTAKHNRFIGPRKRSAEMGTESWQSEQDQQREADNPTWMYSTWCDKLSFTPRSCLNSDSQLHPHYSTLSPTCILQPSSLFSAHLPRPCLERPPNRTITEYDTHIWSQEAGRSLQLHQPRTIYNINNQTTNKESFFSCTVTLMNS